MPRGIPVASLEERFLERFTIEDNNCWVWNSSIGSSGYGQLLKRVWGTCYAHQWASHHWNKTPLPIQRGYCVKHSCDNRLCVNPQHLSYGTLQENIQEMIDRNPDALNRCIPTDEQLELLQLMISLQTPKREMARLIGHSRHWITRVCKDYHL